MEILITIIFLVYPIIVFFALKAIFDSKEQEREKELRKLRIEIDYLKVIEETQRRDIRRLERRERDRDLEIFLLKKDD